MNRKLDIETWERRDHYRFFRQFEEPFFGVCVEVDCTEAYRNAKGMGVPFFLFYLHRSLVAANRTEPFRYRISGEDVLVHDAVHASPTINRGNGTFGFAYLEYREDFHRFLPAARAEVERVRNSTGLVPAVSGENVIHYSSVPWLRFTALSHARAFSFADSCPKITFGKMTESGGRRTMPLSVHVHHALIDGYHVGQFVELFQELMNVEQGTPKAE